MKETEMTEVLDAPVRAESTAGEATDAPADPVPPAEAEAEPTALKGISLWQPWASLIALGAKRIETRVWPTDHRGPIAIHAAKHFTDEEKALCEREPFKSVLEAAGITAETMPTGVVVAVADVADCIQFTEGFDPGEPERFFGDFSPGRFGFKLENVRRLAEPVDCAGAQRVFNLRGGVAEKVLAAVAELTKFEPKPLAWKFDDVLEVHLAYSLALVDGDNPLEYRVGATEGGGWDVERSFAPLLVEPRPRNFPTLEEAQAWCQQREDELAKWASDKPTPTPASEEAATAAPAEATSAAEEKVGSDGGHDVAAPDADMWADITAARHEEREAEDEVESLSEELKDAKKRLEKASGRLGKLIDDAETGQQRFKFQSKAEAVYP
jgi:hypothetical protein